VSLSAFAKASAVVALGSDRGRAGTVDDSVESSPRTLDEQSDKKYVQCPTQCTRARVRMRVVCVALYPKKCASLPQMACVRRGGHTVDSIRAMGGRSVGARKAPPPRHLRTLLVQHASLGQFAEVNYLCRTYASSLTSRHARPVFDWAIAFGNCTTVRLLLELHIVEPTPRNIAQSIRDNNVDCLRALLRAYVADTNALSDGSRSPLHRALTYNRDECIAPLAEAGVNLDRPSMYCPVNGLMAPVSWAVAYSTIAVVRSLVARGVHVNLLTTYMTPLRAAVDTRKLDMLKLVLDAAPLPTCSDVDDVQMKCWNVIVDVHDRATRRIDINRSSRRAVRACVRARHARRRHDDGGDRATLRTIRALLAHDQVDVMPFARLYMRIEQYD